MFTLAHVNYLFLQQVKTGIEALQGLCVSENLNLQLRGIVIVTNIVESNKENATKIIETQMMEILMALAKLEEPARSAVKERATYCLEKAAEWGIIEPAT